jgi:hypothetical protein
MMYHGNMNITELSDDEKSLEFSRLSLAPGMVDGVMDFYKFPDGAKMMEAGVFLLDVFAKAQKDGMEMAYFQKKGEDGKTMFYIFDFVGVVNSIRDYKGDAPLGGTAIVKP